MKRNILLLTVLLFASVVFASDHIIFRDGRMTPVKIHQVSQEKIMFSYIDTSDPRVQEVPSSEVYKIYIEKQGNFYITPEGKRLTGEEKCPDFKKMDVIYLVSGGEIATERVELHENGVYYTVKEKKMFKKSETTSMVRRYSDVFMIRYKSGMIDIITPFEVKPAEPEPEAKPEEPAPKKSVLTYHTVTKGDTLQAIAEKYNITTKQIREWNYDLIKDSTKDTAQLKIGIELMIYVEQ